MGKERSEIDKGLFLGWKRRLVKLETRECVQLLYCHVAEFVGISE